MLTISVDNYVIHVKIVDNFDKLTSIYGVYRRTSKKYSMLRTFYIKDSKVTLQNDSNCSIEWF
jgi:ABC-type transporter lipoprotein component MlaA